MAVTTGRVCWRPRGFLSPSLHRQHKSIFVPGVPPKSVNCRCEKLLKFRLSISFSLLAQAILQTHPPETPWRAAARRPAAQQCRSRRHRRARWLCRWRRTSPGHGSPGVRDHILAPEDHGVHMDTRCQPPCSRRVEWFVVKNTKFWHMLNNPLTLSVYASDPASGPRPFTDLRFFQTTRPTNLSFSSKPCPRAVLQLMVDAFHFPPRGAGILSPFKPAAMARGEARGASVALV
jgi:hypothetical protein